MLPVLGFTPGPTGPEPQATSQSPLRLPGHPGSRDGASQAVPHVALQCSLQVVLPFLPLNSCLVLLWNHVVVSPQDGKTRCLRANEQLWEDN